MKKIAIVAAIWGSFATVASAALSLNFTPILTENSTTPPVGFVSQDMNVTSTTDWTQAQILLNLTTGTIFRANAPFANANGSAPNAGFLGFDPVLRWDTYWKGWGPLDPGDGTLASAGASDFTGAPSATWPGAGVTNGIKLDQGWFNTASGNTGTSSVARFTLSNTAVGTWQIKLLNAGETVTFNGTVAGGLLVVPEPGTIVLVGLSIPVLAYAIRRRKKVA